MPSKTEEYLALAQRTANGLTRYWESWTDYLTTASRLYKYPFADQLMIYAQRPDATACADYDVWNSRMNRYVRRGAKGIALLDESSGFPRLHYVFDVSDTGVRRNSRDPEVWQLGPDLVQPVSEMLSKTYGISGERVSQQLADVAGKLVADYWDNNGGDIRAIVDGSLLMDYDEAGVEMQFKSAAAISVTYTLLERCGIEPAGWFDKDDFQAIYNFSTPDSVYALGAAVSDMSREVLRNIERTVKIFDYTKEMIYNKEIPLLIIYEADIEDRIKQKTLKSFLHDGKLDPNEKDLITSKLNRYIIVYYIAN